MRNPNHDVRKHYDAKIADFIERLRSDPDLSAVVREVKSKILNSPAVRAYAERVVDDVKTLLRNELSSPDTSLMMHLRDGLATLGRRLGSDQNLREAINSHILSMADKLVHDLREGVTDHIAQTVKAWDEQELVDTLELNVGSDLQFIRLNGTLIGGVIGLTLHAAVQFLPAVVG